MVDMAIQRLKAGDNARRTELENTRQEIETDKAAHEERKRQAAKKSFYHFGTLPVEIATNIFSLALEDHAFLVVLAQVCQDWRRIVLSTPALWTTLSLSRKQPAAKAKIWAERSRGFLKELHIRTGDAKTIWALSALKFLPLDSLRCLTIDEADLAEISEHLPVMSPSFIANLETFWATNFPVNSPATARLYEEPEIRWQCFVAKKIAVNWYILADHCTNLRHLTCHGWFKPNDLPDLRWLLHSNPNLETLSLSFPENGNAHLIPRPDTEPHNPPTHIDLPHLKEVSFSGAFLPTYDLLSSLQLPQLRTLHLSMCKGLLDPCLQHVLSSGVAASLVELQIKICVIADMDLLLKILRAATLLESFQLQHIAGVGPIVNALSEPTSDGSSPEPTLPCTKLHSVDFSYCADVRDGGIIRLVKARSKSPSTEGSESGDNSVASLQSLIIDGCDYVDPGIIAWLRQQVPSVSCQYTTKKQARWKR